MTIEQKIKRLEPWLVGVWRFRVKGAKKQWACTYVFDGLYYDIFPKNTLNQALDATWKGIQRIVKKECRICLD